MKIENDLYIVRVIYKCYVIKTERVLKQHEKKNILMNYTSSTGHIFHKSNEYLLKHDTKPEFLNKRISCCL